MKISKLHYISQEINGKSHAQNIREACESGVDWVQLRVKNKSLDEVKAIALEVRKICDEFKAVFLLNDYVAIANEVNADGVHIGKTDMPISEAKAILGKDKLVGATANTFEDILEISREGVDYIGLGPFRFTDTKENLSPIVGLEGYTRIMEKCKNVGIQVPIIAIGGIVAEDVLSIHSTGIYGVAVSSVINKAFNKKEVVSVFINSFEKINQ